MVAKLGGGRESGEAALAGGELEGGGGGGGGQPHCGEEYTRVGGWEEDRKGVVVAVINNMTLTGR